MKKYLVRSVKYLLKLGVLCVGLMAVMHYSAHQNITFVQRLQIMFEQEPLRGIGLLIAIIVLAATYPLIGYVKRSFEGNIITDREQLNSAARLAGLVLVSEGENELVFRASGMRRIMSIFEDKVVVRQKGEQIEVEGLRRLAVYLAFDAEKFITNKRRGE